MSYFLDSVCTIVGIFHKYARCQDGNLALNRREMKTLIQKEFAEVLENPCDPQTIELTFKLLDVNGDSLVDFNEYLTFVFQIAKGCYRYLQPREYLLRDESSRALREGEAGGSKRGGWQLEDGERRGDHVHERQGSDGMSPRSTEEGRRGDLVGRYLPIEPVEEVEEEDSHLEERELELRDGDRRDRPSQEHQEREPVQRWREPEEWEDTEIPEPHQRRQQESALEEDSPRQSRELVRRNDNDRREDWDPLDRDEEDLYSPIVPSRREEMRQRQGPETEGRLFRYGSQTRVDRADYDVVRDEDPRGDESNRREFLEEDRRRDDVRARRGADRTPLQTVEEGRHGELSGELREEADRHFEGHDRELRDGARRDRPSREHQEREPEQRRLEPREWEDIEIPEPRQRRQRESALEEDSPRQSRELGRRNDRDPREARGLLDRDEEDLYSPIVISRREDGRQRRGRETELQEAEGRLFRYGSQGRVYPENHRPEYDVERSRPSRGRQEVEDGRRDLEMQTERRPRALEPRVADDRRDRIRHRSPVEDYEEHRPLSREGERRSQSQEADHRESDRRRQGRSVFQSREDVRRAIRAEEEEVRRSERRRVEDEWSRPRPQEASRRPEVEDLERRERERRRPYSSELENMDRPSRSRESERREEVRRSQRLEDIDQRRREFSREDTRVREVRRRRSQSLEPVARDIRYARSQRYEEPRRDDQRRPHNYEVHSLERDVARRRRVQPRDSPKREDNQERQWDDEHETRDSERDGRRSQLRYSEPRERELRRHQLVDSRVDERGQSREAATRPTQSGSSSPSDSPGEYDQSRQQIYESRHTLQRERTRQSYDRLSNGQRQIWAIGIAQRESEGQRRSNVGVRAVDRFRGVDQRENESQRRSSIHDSDDENTDQRQTQTYETSSREGEDQRRTSSHDSGTRQINQRRTPTYDDGQRPSRMPSRASVDQTWRTHTQADLAEDDQKPPNPYEVDPRDDEQQRTVQSSEPNFRDTGVTQHNMGGTTQPREATSPSNQTADREFDLLRDQRPAESGESQTSRKPGQPEAESSLVSPHEHHQATRDSQRLSGPGQRGPQRRWLQHHQTEAPEEAGVDQVQRKVGSPVSKRATSQPSERQITKGQQSRIQRDHPAPLSPAEGEPEVSLDREGDKAQEPAPLDQQQVHREGEVPQPVDEEPKVEEDDGSGSWAQESQPPLEDDDQQAVMEKPSSSQGDSKSSVICNPLYEYLLAQKKQEQP